jgi:hypothetical protein
MCRSPRESATQALPPLLQRGKGRNSFRTLTKATHSYGRNGHRHTSIVVGGPQIGRLDKVLCIWTHPTLEPSERDGQAVGRSEPGGCYKGAKYRDPAHPEPGSIRRMTP